MHRTTLGDFELTVVNDGKYYLDGGAMFGVVPKPMWEKVLPADEHNRIHMAMNSLVIRTGADTILVDTGAGNKLPDKTRKIFDVQECLLDRLSEAGIAPDDITVVINTHLHFDHAGWNTRRRADGQIVPSFPRAKYYFQKGELAHAHLQHERDRVSYLTDNYDPLVGQRSGRSAGWCGGDRPRRARRALPRTHRASSGCHRGEPGQDGGLHRRPDPQRVAPESHLGDGL